MLHSRRIGICSRAVVLARSIIEFVRFLLISMSKPQGSSGCPPANVTVIVGWLISITSSVELIKG